MFALPKNWCQPVAVVEPSTHNSIIKGSNPASTEREKKTKKVQMCVFLEFFLMVNFIKSCKLHNQRSGAVGRTIHQQS
jgi:hypothetical protein